MLKKLLAVIVLSLIIVDVDAQSDRGRKGQDLIYRKRKAVSKSCPVAYIGISGGINNPAGFLGLNIDVVASPNVTIGSGVGFSTWGYKTFLEGRYYFSKCHRGWAIGSGFTYNTGLTDVLLTDQETINGKADIRISQKSMANFMLSGYHFFNLGRSGRNRFHLNAGFSVPLSEVEFTQIWGPPVTNDTYDAIKAVAPGGISLGFGFTFGLGGQ